MKRFIMSGLSIVLLSAAIAPTAKANESVALSPTNRAVVQAQAHQLQPYDVASLAYQGSFRSVGVPGYGALTSAYEAHTLTADRLVQAAIQSHRLPASVAMDSSYIQAVDRELGFLVRSLSN